MSIERGGRARILTWIGCCTGPHIPSTRYPGSVRLESAGSIVSSVTKTTRSSARRTHVGGVVVPALVDGVTGVRLDSDPTTLGIEEPVPTVVVAVWMACANQSKVRSSRGAGAAWAPKVAMATVETMVEARIVWMRGMEVGRG